MSVEPYPQEASMCNLSRRKFLANSTAFLSLTAEMEILRCSVPTISTQTTLVDALAPDIYFLEGSPDPDHAVAVCNNGWVVFEDYVLVIDANYPAGAHMIISKIHALTDKPIRFAFDTHHHGDHAYGNQVFVENGGVPIAHTGVVEEMRRCETGYYGNKPGAWEDSAEVRPDVKASRLKPPTVLFPKDLIFDDGKHRVELIHLGISHTHGDAVAWLPNEKILFTGDMCVNGPYNYVGDGDVGKWIDTLDSAKRLGARTICTGHGPRSTASVLDDQQAFFRALQDEVGSHITEGSSEEVRNQLESLRASMKARKQIGKYVSAPNGTSPDVFPGQVHKVYEELTGKKLAALIREQQFARRDHARFHGLA
jgi:cyclase